MSRRTAITLILVSILLGIAAGYQIGSRVTASNTGLFEFHFTVIDAKTKQPIDGYALGFPEYGSGDLFPRNCIHLSKDGKGLFLGVSDAPVWISLSKDGYRERRIEITPQFGRSASSGGYPESVVIELQPET